MCGTAPAKRTDNDSDRDAALSRADRQAGLRVIARRKMREAEKTIADLTTLSGAIQQKIAEARTSGNAELVRDLQRQSEALRVRLTDQEG